MTECICHAKDCDLIFTKVEMEAADDTATTSDAAATDAAAGQMETQEQLEEEEVKTNTK